MKGALLERWRAQSGITDPLYRKPGRRVFDAGFARPPRIIDVFALAFLSPVSHFRQPALTKACPWRADEGFHAADSLDILRRRDSRILSGLSVVIHRDHLEDSRRRQLLAVHEVRRRVERGAVAGVAVQRAG